MDLNEDNEWVDAPLEDVLPPYLFSGHSDEDEDEDEEMGVALVIPYKEDDFKKWLIDHQKISAKSADSYIRDYISAYEPLNEIVDIDLFDLLLFYIEDYLEERSSDVEKDMILDAVKIYIQAIQEELENDNELYTKAQYRAFIAYHDFIADLIGSRAPRLLKQKAAPLPDEAEFEKWLEADYHMNYANIKKIVSSVARMDLVLPSIVTDPMSFLDVLRALPTKEKREKYIALVRKYKSQILAKSGYAESTIMNGFANVSLYAQFLSR